MLIKRQTGETAQAFRERKERGRRLMLRALRDVYGVQVSEGASIEALNGLLLKQEGPRRIGGVLTSVIARPSNSCGRWDGAPTNGCEKCHGLGGMGDVFYPQPEPGADPCDFLVYSEYCDCPAGQEQRARDEQRIEQYRRTRLAVMLDKAQIPRRFRDHTLASFPGDRRARELVRAWVERKAGASLFLWGPYGTGKTGLAVAALKGRIGEGQGGRFVDCQLLMQEMRLKRNDPTAVAALIDNCLTVPLLVLDDVRTSERMGDDSWVVDFALEKLTLLVGTRYNAGLPLIVTTNYDPTRLAEDVGPRLASRMQEDALIVEVKPPSLRRVAKVPDGL
jgi:DNA replication protein DnaC